MTKNIIPIKINSESNPRTPSRTNVTSLKITFGNAEIIPSDGLGKVDAGNAVLSRWKITDAERIQLPLRTDQDDLTQYFYLRRNILKAKIALDEENKIYAVNIHATAFATDDTKQKHIAKYKNVLDDLVDQGAIFITGGVSLRSSTKPNKPINKPTLNRKYQ